MLMELLIAMAFLAVATGFALKMHQARLDYDRASLERLQKELAMENLAQLLAVTEYSEIPTVASELAETSELSVEVTPFDFADGEGVHLTIRAATQSGPLSHHAWKLRADP